ncbi:MAG TPA: glycine--tRNA ligase [Streptosporangiaceae bacterium]|nr:glycine--tRNA ligase [Streptosporangiaceae bacterium]
MQDALLALTRYWADRGCLVAQPFNTEVGAGTMNPATVLRVLGPEPWRVAYPEPSVRPDDSRYGENPNRLQTHTQFQVVLKPDPGDPQELYLGSLEALGIDLRAHDVRFVEDNWASPALGAWGLGWEVWLDGLEITQFTYFQQAGGLALDPVSVEITYGIERIMMALQQVSHFSAITYAPGISYGEVFGQAEYEMSRYYLDDADVATMRRLFDDYAAEARRMIDARLSVPAHYYVLKCSHTFNVLDSRGAVSTTERATAFGRMRALARDAARLWAERRAELGHPLGVAAPPPPAAAPAAFGEVREARTALLEIGTEELPAAEVTRAAQALRTVLAGHLDGTRLARGPIRTYATPRRIVALIDDVAPREPAARRTVRGPRVSSAFDAEGQPTRAAHGFARAQGTQVTALGRVSADGVEYVAAVSTDPGRGAVEVLSAVFAQTVAGLRAETNMRWRDPELSYVRPIRWLLALLGDTEVPVAVSSLASAPRTRVHRTAAAPVIEVGRADGYPGVLAAHGVIIDPAARREQIITGARRLAAEVGGTVDAAEEAALIDEVANLVEQPDPVLGGFAERYLELPGEVLTTVMRKHQRYLPVRGPSGTLLPAFVAVANGPCDHDVVRAGNEAVLRARYEDAAFFWRADLQTPPQALRRRLGQLAFEQRLGSMADRADRIAGAARALALPGGAVPPLVALDEDEQRTLDRAAPLAKFDLASQMVIELTSLAGVMAREYALRSGEPAAVAQALADIELPRSAGGALPQTRPGAILALADRLDLLAGLFAVGATPTGSSDPFGLRRAALGVTAILRAWPALAPVTLTAGLAAAAAQLRGQGVNVPGPALAEAREFVIRRLEQQLLDAGADHRHVAAVLPLADAPALAEQTLTELAKLAARPEFAELASALQRVRRIVPAGTAPAYEPGHLTEPAEAALHRALSQVRAELGPRRPGLAEFAEKARPLTGPVNAFFDEILVMTDDPGQRAARLGLLASISDLAAPVLDWAALGPLR